MQNGKTMLNLTKFRQNFRPVWAKMMANLFRRGISGVFFGKKEKRGIASGIFDMRNLGAGHEMTEFINICVVWSKGASNLSAVQDD